MTIKVCPRCHLTWPGAGDAMTCPNCGDQLAIDITNRICPDCRWTGRHCLTCPECRAALVEDASDVIVLDDFALAMFEMALGTAGGDRDEAARRLGMTRQEFDEKMARRVEKFKKAVEKILERNGGNQDHAAISLGMTREELIRKLALGGIGH